jgi:hypothetical protein
MTSIVLLFGTGSSVHRHWPRHSPHSERRALGVATKDAQEGQADDVDEYSDEEQSEVPLQWPAHPHMHTIVESMWTRTRCT